MPKVSAALYEGIINNILIMRKAFLLLSMVTTCAYAQFQPYVFKGTQLYKPIQEDNTILQQSIEKLERASYEATEQYSKLQLLLAEYGDKLYNDEETLLWFDKYKKEIEQSYESMRGFGPYDARNYAIRKQGEIANDPELMARIRTANEYRAAVQSIRQRSDMSQQEKMDWIADHPYCFIPIANSDGKIIGGKLGTKAELEAYKAEVQRKARLLEESNRARLYAMAHPFDNIDYARYDKVIDYPQCRFYPTPYSISDGLRISRIALSSTETRVEFEFTNTVFNWFNVERGTYIKASGTNKLAFIRAENVAIAPSMSTFEKSGEILKFALIFPSIPQKAKSFLIAEPYKKGWKFKDIKVQ